MSQNGKDGKVKHIRLTVNPELHKQLKELTVKYETTLSAIITAAIEEIVVSASNGAEYGCFDWEVFKSRFEPEIEPRPISKKSEQN